MIALELHTSARPYSFSQFLKNGLVADRGSGYPSAAFLRVMRPVGLAVRAAEPVMILFARYFTVLERRARTFSERIVFGGKTFALACLLMTSQTGCQMAASGNNVSGVRLYQQGQYQAAMQRFQQALAVNPGDADAYYNLGATTHRIAALQNDQAQYTQAEGLYHQCLDMKEDHTDCRRALAVLLVETDRRDSAFTMLQRWVDGRPHVADARVELARLYEEFGDKETAERHLVDAVAIDSSHARAWTALASLREQNGEYAQALNNYQNAQSLNRFQPGVSERIAALQQNIGPLAAPTLSSTRSAALPSRPLR